jgi:hypothetical protein
MHVFTYFLSGCGSGSWLELLEGTGGPMRDILNFPKRSTIVEKIKKWHILKSVPK